MEQDQDEAEGAAGWPLGLLPVTLQMQQQLANAFSNTLHLGQNTSTCLLATPTSCSSDLESSDLDTESSLFSFQARSITLGSLMGIRSMNEPNLIRARSLVLASSCASQASTLQCPSHHQSFDVLELICRTLAMQRHQFKRLATDVSAKLCNNLFFRCISCVEAQLCHKQICGSSTSCWRPTQPITEEVDNSSLADLLQMDREACSFMLPLQHQTVLIDVMYEGA